MKEHQSNAPTHVPDEALTSSERLTGLELRSLITRQGELELSLVEVDPGDPTDDEVIVRVEATPLNPSDIGLLIGPADIGKATGGGTSNRPTLRAPVPEATLGALASRVDQSMPVGNEGAGVVIRAGARASDLLGKTVSMVGGAMYTQYRRIHRDACFVLDEGITPAQGAAAFVNPLTVLGMVETMRREGHHAIVHTAAASSVGQMLVKLCQEEGVALVNVVRSEAQVQVLQNLGAKYVLNSTSPTFEADLIDALAATGATLCFDALGGGPVTGTILSSMEKALGRTAKEYKRYGSSVHKQIYIYGVLDPRPIELPRVGMAWGVGGWLVFDFLAKIGPLAAQKLRERVNRGLRTTFASQYVAEISLADALTPSVASQYAKRSTGEKYLINPAKRLGKA
ncbi:zinc-binding dehydrogenase [Pandoraea sp. NPDC087047]|uniref:zinc-binding dehydrogenase n=1 Tax=Pandoraea sp. NPDC087047 TaxID=3364390 RepID=UPI00382FE3E4